MKNFEPINSPISLLALLLSGDAASTVEYRQQLDGKTLIRWEKEELLKKPLSDLIVLANKMHFRITKL